MHSSLFIWKIIHQEGTLSRRSIDHGTSDEKPFLEKIVVKGQTAVIDRYYQYHKDFDDWQEQGIHFVGRIRENTTKEVVRTNDVSLGSILFYDAMVYLGVKGLTRTRNEVRVMGYRVDGKEYRVATDRYDLTGEEIALIYKLRWSIEIFFGWWKRRLRVYHLIARTQHGMLVQILAGLITYLLLAIYCHNNYREKVTIKRVRELRIKIRNESAQTGGHFRRPRQVTSPGGYTLYART